ncbi:MAG: glycosyltransferase family 2 protein [Lachnospiraceae bacterium]|nr:glycosyltransferase family 2 protein [Lachnospiraceae bacterium]
MEIFIKDKVSAVIPVFNGALHLSSMLDSILGQTYSSLEVILVDDGSTDKTLEVAESYREKFVSKGYDYRIVQSEHKNASAALNRGFPYVTGEYLIWPDSDDRLEKESVETRVRFLQENPGYHCVRSLSYYFQQETGTLLPADEKTGDISKEDLFWDILEGRTYVCCGCYMLRTESFFKIYPRRRIPEYDVGQNFQMLLPFMFHHQCPTIPEKLYGVCVRPGSHSRRILTKEEEEKKYQDYERLVDEIAFICRIQDKESKERIQYWKIRRRYSLAVKFKDRKRMIGSLWKMRWKIKKYR